MDGMYGKQQPEGRPPLRPGPAGPRIDTVLRVAQALHYASKAGFTGVMEVLLKNHAPVDARSDMGETPLFFALKAGPRTNMVRTVELLLSHGADPHREDDSGKTPWSIARRMRHPDAGEIIALFDAASSRQTA